MPNNTNTSNKMTFTTKYKLGSNEPFDTLQSPQQGDTAVNNSVNDNSGGNSQQATEIGVNYIDIKTLRLTGKDSGKNLNEIEEIRNGDEFAVSAPSQDSVFTEKRGRRLFKKDGIIYDLLN